MTLHFSAPVSPASSISSYEHGGDQQSQQQPRHSSWLLAGLDAAAHHPWKPKRETSRSHDSGASNGSVEVECRAKFKELNAENLKLLCAALEKEVPWQKEIVAEVASAVLQCRSGIAKRRDKSRSADHAKEETWMFFLGADADGKERVARELASLVFGSRNSFVSIRPGGASSPPAAASSGSSDGHHRSNKRPRMAYLERLHEAVSENPHRVIFMEDVEQADRDCQLGIKEAIESGVVRNHAGEEVGVGDAIVILSCESFDDGASRSRACSPPSKKVKVEMEEGKEERTADHEHNEDGASSSSPSCIDLNVDMESDQADERSLGDVCLLTAVDRTLFFRRQEN